MNQRRVSMVDVARHAGVSAQTVSRVVTGSARVEPATRQAVETAMADLGYRVHRAARALRTGRTGMIGVIVASLATVGSSRMLQAIAEAAAARGYVLMVLTAPERAAITEGFERLRDQGVDGAILLNEATALAHGVEVPPELALVVVDSEPDDRFVIVQTDHARGAREAVDYLLGLGHESVHHLAGPADSYAAEQRERGWRQALRDADAPVVEPVRGDWSSASGHAMAATLPAEMTALFCANDQMALGALRALAEAGRRVPEDVAVIGFDDVVDAADYRPPLTTVRQDFAALAEGAVAALVAAIEDTDTHVAAPVPARLVVRESA